MMEGGVGLFDLAWEDVVFSHILPYLSLKDVFSLRGICREAVDLVDEYFCQLKVIDLSSHIVNRRFNIDAFNVLTRRCRGVRRFVLTEATWVKDDVLRDFFAANNTLSLVDLSGCSGLTGKCMLSLAVKCKGLKELRLRECSWITRGALETIMSHVKALEVVDISSCASIGDPFIINFVQRFPTLRRIHVAHIQTVDDTTLLAIGRSCPDLRVLDIRACMSVTDNGIRCIVEYCGNLVELYVVNCHLVTEYSLVHLRSKVGLSIDRPPPQGAFRFIPFRDNVLMVQV